jgi:hypothetical protein
MAERTRKVALYLKAESSYGVEAGSTDGSDFTACKCLSLDLLQDNTNMLETNFATGRNRQTEPEVGADGAQITFTTPVQGLVGAAADGTAASSVADDWFDLILTNVFGAPRETTGEGLTASASASSLDVDTDAFTNQDMVAVQGASFDSGKVNWRRVSGTASPYTMDRNLNATPDGSEIAYGAKIYRNSAAGASLSACYDLDGTIYLLKGGRVSSMSIEMTAGELATLSVTMDFDSKQDDSSTKTALPTLGTLAGTPVKGLLGAFAWGSTEYAARTVSVDFGITMQPDATVTTANGRADMDIISIYPTVTVEPAYAQTFVDDMTGGTSRALSIQFGSGVVSGGVLNGCNLFMEKARLTQSNPSDDGGRLRSSLQFQCVDAGIFSGSIIAEYFQFSRA